MIAAAPEPASHKFPSSNPHKTSALLICLGMTLFAAIVPFCRAFFRVEIDYNEGWNIYNASIAAAHGWLYPAKYGWTSNNYPMLSFVAMAQLHRITHDYLFTARIVSLLSLLSSAAIVGAIVYRLCGRKAYRPAILAALFTIAVFCANADVYVGMDDPQILAQVFFLAGLYVYIATHRSLGGIAAAALLFVVGGFIKHNLIDFPLAVLIDLALISRWKAAWFSICGLALAAIGLALNIHFGGPHFIDQLLAPRTWSASKAALNLRNALGPILLPILIAGYTAVKLRKDDPRRILAILFAASILAGAYFGGGQGVAVNALFDTMLATAILIGLPLSETTSSPNLPTNPWLKPSLFLWLFIPLLISGNWNPVRILRETAAQQTRFDTEVQAIAAAPGRALCESLLRCYSAGKPYVYDPFNATRLIQLHKLDQTAFVDSIRNRAFGAIQLDVPIDDTFAIENNDPALHDRFTPEMLTAIQQSYTPALKNEDGVIYLPRTR